MVRDIVKDVIFLAQKSTDATPEDAPLANDMLETLEYHREGCVGMAANMVGAAKRIIVFDDNGQYSVMYNPEIIKASGRYETEEGCLSLAGTRKTVRYKTVKVRWQDAQMRVRIKNFTGFTAQIIQHEIDHTNGIII